MTEQEIDHSRPIFSKRRFSIRCTTKKGQLITYEIKNWGAALNKASHACVRHRVDVFLDDLTAGLPAGRLEWDTKGIKLYRFTQERTWKQEHRGQKQRNREAAARASWHKTKSYKELTGQPAPGAGLLDGLLKGAKEQTNELLRLALARSPKAILVEFMANLIAGFCAGQKVSDQEWEEAFTKAKREMRGSPLREMIESLQRQKKRDGQRLNAHLAHAKKTPKQALR